jgi:anti-sigma factor RsiW
MTAPAIPEPHEEAEELLPWYVTGRLDAADRARVETHLAGCARCQRQLKLERRLVEEFRTVTPEVDAGWARLRGRIEAPRQKRSSWLAVMVADLRQISRPAIAALATVAVLIIGSATVLLTFMNQPAYETLGSGDVSASANVIVMFRAETTEADMRDALRASGAALVGGPTSADAYLLHVRPQARASALAKLRASDDVTLAEPIDGPGR